MEITQLVAQSIHGAVGQVFSTMLGLETVNHTEEDDFSPPPFFVSGVTGSVSFAGRFTGAVYFAMPPQTATRITTQIVGEDTVPAETQVNDVIGELTNMITGNLKSKLCDAGFNCQLSIPSLMRGDEIRVSAKGSGIWVAKKFMIPDWSESVLVRVLAKVDTKDGK